MVGRSKQRQAAKPALTVHQIVAYNFRLAREEVGWTQAQTSDQLEPYLGYRLNQAGVSAIEKTFDSERRRNIDVAEVVAFARCFDKPVNWFFLPPEDYADHLVEPIHRERADERYNLDVPDLIAVAIGRPVGWQAITARLDGLLKSRSHRRFAKAVEWALDARDQNYEEQINLRRSTMQQIAFVYQMTPHDEAVIKLAEALIEMVRLTPEGFLKLRGADRDKALELLAEGDRLVQPFIKDAVTKRATETVDERDLRGYDLLEPIDPRVALGFDEDK